MGLCEPVPSKSSASRREPPETAFECLSVFIEMICTDVDSIFWVELSDDERVPQPEQTGAGSE